MFFLGTLLKIRKLPALRCASSTHLTTAERFTWTPITTNTKTLHSAILTTLTSGACRTRAICSVAEILFRHYTRPTRRAATSSECRTQAICSAAETRHKICLAWRAVTSSECLTRAICLAAESLLLHKIRLTWKAATSNACSNRVMCSPSNSNRRDSTSLSACPTQPRFLETLCLQPMRGRHFQRFTFPTRRSRPLPRALPRACLSTPLHTALIRPLLRPILSRPLARRPFRHPFRRRIRLPAALLRALPQAQKTVTPPILRLTSMSPRLAILLPRGQPSAKLLPRRLSTPTHPSRHPARARRGPLSSPFPTEPNARPSHATFR
mmetsp:Transcript_15710/g.24866  ORF Transcript_15710/g.24866 Transcript_15710/m.24866 type:complete len:324 (-) Transcript_15710:105-1076(-)